MKAIDRIREYLNDVPDGEPFTTSSLRHLASADNTRQILNRLVKQGEIVRVGRGIFVKPKIVANVGEALPLLKEVVETIAKATGETVTIHGAEAARQLGLTTQVPMRLVLYTSGNSRKVKVKNKIITLKHISQSKLIAPYTLAGTIITALLYLGKNEVSQETLQRIEGQFTSEEFEALYEQMKYMPAWLANHFYFYKRKKTGA